MSLSATPPSPSASPLPERLARLAYNALWYVVTPLIAGYLLWRSRRQPDYRRHWGERFLGRPGGTDAVPEGCLWIHAVSVGETRAAVPLVEALLLRHPRATILVTHMTPTGRDTAILLFGDRVSHAYLAYDYPHAVRTFLRRWRPRVGVVMETEIWPQLMAAAEREGIPMILANARLSARSLSGAQRWSALMRPAARRFTRILAQTTADAERFAQLTRTPLDGPRLAVVGNVKFDMAIPEAQRALARTFVERLVDAPHVFLFASTRDGEEAAIVDAWRRHGRGSAPDGRRVLPAIVPRHPQRFQAVVESIATVGLTVQRRSDDRPVAASTAVWVGDSMGELAAYYLVADVAYVGGSIAPLGGQNLIEAAAAACPVLLGPHTFNFAAASDAAVAAGAATRVTDYDALIIEGLAIIDDAARRRRMSDSGLAFAASHRGATERTADVIDAWGRADALSSP